eukprot:1178108-Prorocentrum_minimum.AAC.1
MAERVPTKWTLRAAMRTLRAAMRTLRAPYLHELRAGLEAAHSEHCGAGSEEDGGHRPPLKVPLHGPHVGEVRHHVAVQLQSAAGGKANQMRGEGIYLQGGPIR